MWWNGNENYYTGLLCCVSQTWFPIFQKEEYMSVEQAREQIQNQQAWNLYKREMVRQLAEKTKRGSR